MQLRVELLSAWYGQARVLWDVNLHVGVGEVVGVLGRNGAGKTTLLRSIAGLHPKVAGSVHGVGADLTDVRANEIALKGLALVREGARLPSSLTVVQNISLGQRLAQQKGKPGKTVRDIWNWFPILEPLADRRAGLLSGGQRQALALAVAFASEPEILLLDEPSAGLAPPVAKELFGSIRQLAAHGVAVLVVEQHPAWLIGLAERAYLLEVGKVMAEGSVERILEEIKEAAIA
jgi:branched-chain amino acid transport system ATP-binding protein